LRSPQKPVRPHSWTWVSHREVEKSTNWHDEGSLSDRCARFCACQETSRPCPTRLSSLSVRCERRRGPCASVPRMDGAIGPAWHTVSRRGLSARRDSVIEKADCDDN